MNDDGTMAEDLREALTCLEDQLEMTDSDRVRETGRSLARLRN